MTSRCSAASSPGRAIAGAVRGRRAAQHRRPPRGHLSRAAHYICTRLLAARSAARIPRRASSNDAAELLATRDANWEARLVAYWQARDHFLELGRNVRPAPDVREMLAQVREPLLSVLRISPDFRPAYDPLLRMAYGIAPRDAGMARELLAQLVREQPDRPEAAEAMRELGPSP